MVTVLKSNFTRNLLSSSFIFIKPVSFQNYSYRKFQTMPLPLTQVIQRLKTIAPLNLAESWDNVGLLIEPDQKQDVSSILLTIDLTEDVVQEAVDVGAQLIISYHPNIFKPLKSVTQSTWKERIIVKCIKNNITVFSPHTTWDAMENGVNDWLASSFSIKDSKPIIPNSVNPNIGMGRLLSLTDPVTLREVIESVKSNIGIPHLRLGLGKGKTLESPIVSVALCAGSGASVLSGIEADLYLTGEMLHHDVLDATQRGINVILCNHSDSERGYLQKFKTLLADEQLNIFVSKVDKDCLTTV